MKKTLIVITLILVMTIISCIPSTAQDGQEIEFKFVTRLEVNYFNSVYRFTDPETNVTCYIVDIDRGGGISCMILDGEQ